MIYDETGNVRNERSERSQRSQNPMHQRFKTAVQNVLASMRSDADNGRTVSMDDTWAGGGTSRHSQPPIPPNDSEFRVNDRRAVIPQWLLLFLIVQGGTIIWWA